MIIEPTPTNPRSPLRRAPARGRPRAASRPAGRGHRRRRARPTARANDPARIPDRRRCPLRDASTSPTATPEPAIVTNADDPVPPEEFGGLPVSRHRPRSLADASRLAAWHCGRRSAASSASTARPPARCADEPARRRLARGASDSRSSPRSRRRPGARRPAASPLTGTSRPTCISRSRPACGSRRRSRLRDKSPCDDGAQVRGRSAGSRRPPPTCVRAPCGCGDDVRGGALCLGGRGARGPDAAHRGCTPDRHQARQSVRHGPGRRGLAACGRSQPGPTTSPASTRMPPHSRRPVVPASRSGTYGSWKAAPRRVENDSSAGCCSRIATSV